MSPLEQSRIERDEQFLNSPRFMRLHVLFVRNVIAMLAARGLTDIEAAELADVRLEVLRGDADALGTEAFRLTRLFGCTFEDLFRDMHAGVH